MVTPVGAIVAGFLSLIGAATPADARITSIVILLARDSNGEVGWISAVPDRCGFHCPSADSGRSHLTRRP
jgi:hypothetical protein